MRSSARSAKPNGESGSRTTRTRSSTRTSTWRSTGYSVTTGASSEMAQFDVFKNPHAGLYPYLLDIQTDLLGSLATRIVVPLVSLKKYVKPITRLHPTAIIAGVEYVLKFHDLAAVPSNVLGKPIESLAHRRQE